MQMTKNMAVKMSLLMGWLSPVKRKTRQLLLAMVVITMKKLETMKKTTYILPQLKCKMPQG